MDLIITRDVDDAGRDRLVLTGSIDLASKDSFLLAARAVLRDGATTLVADLAGITFMDSTGIGSLIEVTRDAEDAGASVVLRAPSDRIRRLLDITGLAGQWLIEV